MSLAPSDGKHQSKNSHSVCLSLVQMDHKVNMTAETIMKDLAFDHLLAINFQHA